MTLRKVSRDVTVLVTHRDMPIAGITVSVLPENHIEPVFIGNTDSRGIVVIRKLSFGKYFVTAVHDGLEAGKDWIEVVAKPDAKTVRSSLLVPEVPHSGEEHRQAKPVGGSNDFRIALRAARLDDGGSSRLGDLFHAVGEGKKGIGGRNRAL
jgi:hypothetical protein